MKINTDFFFFFCIRAFSSNPYNTRDKEKMFKCTGMAWTLNSCLKEFYFIFFPPLSELRLAFIRTHTMWCIFQTMGHSAVHRHNLNAVGLVGGEKKSISRSLSCVLNKCTRRPYNKCIGNVKEGSRIYKGGAEIFWKRRFLEPFEASWIYEEGSVIFCGGNLIHKVSESFEEGSWIYRRMEKGTQIYE